MTPEANTEEHPPVASWCIICREWRAWRDGFMVPCGHGRECDPRPR